MDMFLAAALAPGGIIAWLIVGGIAGWATGRIMGGGYGFFGDIILGLIGAFVGGLIMDLLIPDATAGFWTSILVAIVGSVIVVAIWRAISHSGATRRV